MTAALFQDITTHGAAVNLSSHAKFRLTGGDRVRYLNGQVTNDTRRAKSDETLYACVTDVKGRIAGDVFIHAREDALLLDAEAGLRESLGTRLERYIVADDVELTDVTDDWQLWHVFGPAAANGLKSWRFGVDGVDVWLPSGEPFEPGCRVLSDDDLETWRIVQKVPRWPNELNAETFPPETGIEARAMDFAKGCYIGQEVLSRIKTTGKMPRELIAFETAVVVNVGEELWTEKAVGKITSIAKHPVTGLTTGLAMVRQGTTQEGFRVGGSDGPLMHGG
ncbi:MAG: YgfZ/GcvT domain-containing protein [Prosthecobacter sp.]|uniref:CAF17-like 4Fe-4S cluster assembly/insertion protein YgfZ n=1 Tax=Prosthecobacter sp. TaxID=1965333 RepID=UPI0038FDD08D